MLEKRISPERALSQKTRHVPCLMFLMLPVRPGHFRVTLVVYFKCLLLATRLRHTEHDRHENELEGTSPMKLGSQQSLGFLRAQ